MKHLSDLKWKSAYWWWKVRWCTQIECVCTGKFKRESRSPREAPSNLQHHRAALHPDSTPAQHSIQHSTPLHGVNDPSRARDWYFGGQTALHHHAPRMNPSFSSCHDSCAKDAGEYWCMCMVDVSSRQRRPDSGRH